VLQDPLVDVDYSPIVCFVVWAMVCTGLPVPRCCVDVRGAIEIAVLQV